MVVFQLLTRLKLHSVNIHLFKLFLIHTPVPQPSEVMCGSGLFVLHVEQQHARKQRLAYNFDKLTDWRK